MGNITGKHDSHHSPTDQSSKTVCDTETRSLTMDPQEDNEVFAEADVNQNNGSSSKQKKMVAPGSKSVEDPKNAWKSPSTAEPAGRPHLVRLFSRDAPGREDNTFKDRPSESEDLQAIQEDSSVPVSSSDLMEVQKLSSQSSAKKGQVAKQMASASASDHAKQAGGAHSRQRDSGILDQLGKFFGQEGSRKVPEKGKEPATRSVLMAPTTHKAHQGAGRQTDDSAVVHFFKNMMSPKKAPVKQKARFGASRAITKFIWGTDGQRPHYGAAGSSKSKEAYRGRRDGSGTLSSFFKMGKKGEGSPARR
ncbi:myelin basic protein isoform X1 [Chiloscyllium plagiosum]|uniref:myelin basic protein isoform X1 n=1 Tax=Chiloscyllium plagiosum TaxID=36176 RepID=UPI001CB7E953|nr:myelin basic protein isoform X1 [Chiloscyllium plagiosum]XP_043544566.1 myelin basic protein isoform X1 [Chiloscyllium plagiosum]